jgi:flavin reductase (DIM6/NTAB) family NADH-FMN oxidoreductase RutF
MEKEVRKQVLRMIPYGLYVLTSRNEKGEIGAGTINWVTQGSFEPPLLVICVKKDSFVHKVIEVSGAFALNFLGKGQKDQAFLFFKPAEVKEKSISGIPYEVGSTGSPILKGFPAFVECKVVEKIFKGDHTIFVGEVVEAGISISPAGRLDELTLHMKDLGENVYYGG